MKGVAYTRFELRRTMRNGRLLVFALGFPVIVYFAIAAPNRDVDDWGDTGISLPLYYMVGLVGFGTMMALIFTIVIVAIALSGSLWVMYHLNVNMMPMAPGDHPM